MLTQGDKPSSSGGVSVKTQSEGSGCRPPLRCAGNGYKAAGITPTGEVRGITGRPVVGFFKSLVESFLFNEDANFRFMQPDEQDSADLEAFSTQYGTLAMIAGVAVPSRRVGQLSELGKDVLSDSIDKAITQNVQRSQKRADDMIRELRGNTDIKAGTLDNRHVDRQLIDNIRRTNSGLRDQSDRSAFFRLFNNTVKTIGDIASRFNDFIQ